MTLFTCGDAAFGNTAMAGDADRNDLHQWARREAAVARPTRAVARLRDGVTAAKEAGH